MSNRELPMMPWYPDQFASSVSTWPWQSRYLYRCLLDLQWAQGCIPTREVEIARCAAMQLREVRKYWPLVRTKFETAENGTARNQRLEYHRIEARRRHEQKVMAGSAGGLARAQAALKHSSSSAQAALKPLSPSPSEESKNPLTPPSGGGASQKAGNGSDGKPRRQAGTNPRAQGTNPRATGTSPRDLGTNPREVEWEALRQRAKMSGFRAPYTVDSPETYETSLRVWELNRH